MASSKHNSIQWTSEVSSTWMWSEMGEWIALVCAHCLLPSSTWHENQRPKLFKARSNHGGFLSVSHHLPLFLLTEMHWHSDWEGVLGTCWWWEGHLQLLGLTFLIAIFLTVWHSANRYVMERMKATELHSSYPAAIWTSLFNNWDQDSHQPVSDLHQNCSGLIHFKYVNMDTNAI